MDVLDSIDHERIGRAIGDAFEGLHERCYDDEGFERAGGGHDVSREDAARVITELEALGYTIVRKPIV